MRTVKFVLLIIISVAAMQAQGQTKRGEPGGANNPPPPPPPPPAAHKPPDTGRIEAGRYINEFFAVSFNVPRDWTVNRTEIPQAAEEFMRDIASNKAQQESLNASMARSTILLNLSKLPPGPSSQFNASLVVVAERIPSAIVKTGEDILRMMEKGFQNTAVKVEFIGGIRTVRIGGADFATTDVRTEYPVGPVMQKYYVTIRKGFALEIIYSYVDESDLKTFDEVVGSITIK